MPRGSKGERRLADMIGNAGRKPLLIPLLASLVTQSAFAQSSPLCSMYNGQRPTDPIYTRQFEIIAASPGNKCAEEMAIRLAPAPERADAIAKAAVFACGDQADSDAKNLPPTGQGHQELLSIVEQVMNEVALLAVITVRAGHCLPQNSN